MYLLYRNYRHALGEADVAITREVVENEARQPVEEVHRWTIRGLLGTGTAAASPQAIDSKVRDLVAAYNQNGGDLVLTLPDGRRATQLTLRSAGSIGGVKIVQKPSFPTMTGAGYVTNLQYEITAEARYPVANAGSLLRTFEETLTFSGGGPEYGFLSPLVGQPIKQRLRQQTTYKATQSGRAVGMYARPRIAAPIWRSDLMRNPDRSIRSPRYHGGGGAYSYTDFEVTWNYEFESVRPLVGNPNVWI